MTEKKHDEESLLDSLTNSPKQPGLTSPDEIQAFVRFCAKLLKKASIPTDALTYRKEKFEKIERAGILSFKTKRRTLIRNIPDQKCWKIGEMEQISKPNGVANAILLSEDGKLYLEESTKDPKDSASDNPADHHVWTALADEHLQEVLPLLDRYLDQNGIEMSAEQFVAKNNADGLKDTDEKTDQPQKAKKHGSYTLVVVKPGNVDKLAKGYQMINESTWQEAMEWAQSDDEVICSMDTSHLLGYAAQRLLIKYGIQTKTKRRTVHSQNDQEASVD